MPGSYLDKILREIGILGAYAEKVYGEYKDSGQKFVFAQVLYRTNTQIKEKLTSILGLLPETQIYDGLALLLHLDVWSAIWLAESKQQTPHWDDAFTFPTLIPFPRKSLARLLELRDSV